MTCVCHSLKTIREKLPLLPVRKSVCRFSALLIVRFDRMRLPVIALKCNYIKSGRLFPGTLPLRSSRGRVFCDVFMKFIMIVFDSTPTINAQQELSELSVKSALLHVLSLAQFAFVYTRGRATHSPNANVRLKREVHFLVSNYFPQTAAIGREFPQIAGKAAAFLTKVVALSRQDLNL